MIVGLQSLTLKYIARVFSLKSYLEKLLLTILWVMWAYIVLVKKWGKHNLKELEAKGFAGHSCDLAWVAKWLTKSSLAWDYSDSSMCLSCGLSPVVHSRASREPVMKSLSSQIFTKLSHLTLTLNPIKIQENDWIKI